MIFRDVRLAFVEVEVIPTSDPDAPISIGVRDAEERHGIAAWLTADSARELATYINRRLLS